MSYLKLLAALAKARSNKRRPQFPRVSSAAFVNTYLNPLGSVFIGGELWKAETLHGESVSRRTMVTVVGFRDHLLLVEERS